MNNTNTKNTAINPCSIKYNDIANSMIECWTIGSIGFKCEQHITTKSGDTYKRYDGITNYSMTDQSSGNITRCPHEWWQNWTQKDNQ